jgi:hypothetical protein
VANLSSSLKEVAPSLDAIALVFNSADAVNGSYFPFIELADLS